MYARDRERPEGYSFGGLQELGKSGKSPMVEDMGMPSRAPLHGGVLQRLRRMIIRCELQPGDRISEEEFGQAFGVSRTPLREALRLLAAEGLVEIRPHKGAVIAEISHSEISDTFDLMSALEQMAGPIACERVSNIDLKPLENLINEMDNHHANANLEGYFELNTEFHNKIVALGDNKVLTRVYAEMFRKLQRARYRVNYDAERWQESCAEHHWIMDALRTRNGVELGHRLKEHNAKTAKAVITQLTMSGLRKRADPGVSVVQAVP
jgi:DNA-binding GntR family transcriptional regulator